MAVTTETNRTAEQTTDGVETDFDFSMLIHSKSEVQVWWKATGGNYSQLTLDTDYSVVFTEDGGTVTTIGVPLAAGKLLIIRHIKLTQETNWLYNDNHTGPQHEDDFDRSSMRDIQIQEQLDRCPQFLPSSGTTGITFPEPEANTILGWNAGGTNLTNISPITLAVLIAGDIIAGSVPEELTDLTDVTIDTPVTGDLLRYDGTMWVNYPDSNYQSADAGLTSIAGLTTAADKMIYTTALDTYAVAPLTAFARTLLDDANAAAGATTLGLGTGNSPTFTDLTLSTPSNIYSLSHDSFTDFLTKEHIDWTNTSEDLKTTGSGRFDGGLWCDGSTGSTPTSGAGTRLMWIPDKGAFRAGVAKATEWDNDNIGIQSAALGRGTKALGAGALAAGFCEGDNTTIIASKEGGVALGFSYTISGTPTTITASYLGSTAMGMAADNKIESTAAGSFAQGYANSGSITSSNWGSIAQGCSQGTIIASGLGSRASGYATQGNTLAATGIGSVAEGTDVQATENYTLAYGKSFTNFFPNSFAVGFGAIDLLITSNNANFQDCAIVTTGTLGAGAITGTSFIIGANTLTTTEWAFLDGLDQALKTTDNVQFAKVGIGKVPSANLDVSGTALISSTLGVTGATLLSSTLDVIGNIDPTSYETTRGGFKDEDNFASNSDTAVASQQSIKAYVYSKTSTGIWQIPLESAHYFPAGVAPVVIEYLSGWLLGYEFGEYDITFPVPKDWDGASDFIVKCFLAIYQNEDAGNDIPLVPKMFAIGEHENVVGQPTQDFTINHDIGNYTTAGTIHQVSITLDYDDVTAPIAAGDVVVLRICMDTDLISDPGYTGYVFLVEAELAYTKP